MKKLTKLTANQCDRMSSHADEWVQYGFRTQPLTEQEWQVWEAGARKCYEYAGARWPDKVVRLPSPQVATFVVPRVQRIIDDLRHVALMEEKVTASIDGFVGDSMMDTAKATLTESVVTSVTDIVGASMLKSVQDVVLRSTSMRDSLLASASVLAGDSLVRAIEDTVRAPVEAALKESVASSVLDEVRLSVRDPAGFQLRILRDSTWESTIGASRPITTASSRWATTPPASRPTTPGQPRITTDVFGWGGELTATLQDRAVPGWQNYSGGRLWCDWDAYVAFFRDVANHHVADLSIWDRSRAYQDAQSAGWWYPSPDFVMVCDVPSAIHLETIPRGRDWGRWEGRPRGPHVPPLPAGRRLHCETGPAVGWTGGLGIYFWHGVRVPAWVIEAPSATRALQERNTEVRRAAIEAVGWENVVDELELKPIDRCRDFANGKNDLLLYELPREVYNARANLLLMTNASPDLDGRVRRYGEPVPSRFRRADEAAAWQSEVPVEVYRQLQRCT